MQRPPPSRCPRSHEQRQAGPRLAWRCLLYTGAAHERSVGALGGHRLRCAGARTPRRRATAQQVVGRPRIDGSVSCDVGIREANDKMHETPYPSHDL